jgi:PLP dependent protein
MSDIAGNITLLKQQIPSSVKLVAVSKTMPVGDILKAYNTGHRTFGENRVQELISKADLLPKDIEWHLIGHLQRNKVKAVVPFIDMIQSVDSFRLLRTIDSEAAKISRTINCLLQIYIAEEETKFGFSMDELIEEGELEDSVKLKNIKICGVMGMATFTSDTKQIEREFNFLSNCFKKLKSNYFRADPRFKEISMGMSDDYRIAIKGGSTIIRIGSLIFGTRNNIKN